MLAYASEYGLQIAAQAISAAVLVGMLSTPVVAGQVAGNVVAVQPKATLSNPEGSISLKVGMDVAVGDRIKTGRNGEVQLIFSDKTRLVVGPKSSLIIEAYLLRSNNRANNFTVRALGGSFRMITGKSKKKAYKIKTPTATIGVRGTSFDFTVRSNGETGLVLYDGAAEICGRGGTSCQVLTGRCSVAQAPRRDDVRVLREIENRNTQIKRNFPYAVSQQSLRKDFRVRTSSCGNLAKVIDPKERTPRAAPQRSVAPEPTPPSPPSQDPGPPSPPGQDPGPSAADPEHNHGHTKPDYHGKSPNADGHDNGNSNSNGKAKGRGKDKSNKKS